MCKCWGSYLTPTYGLTEEIGNLSAQHPEWGEGSAQKMLLHGLAGVIEAKIAGGNALTGLAAGVANEAMIPVMDAYLRSQGIDRNTEEYRALMRLGSTLVGAALGALTGGHAQDAATGANIGVVAIQNNFLGHLEKAELEDLRNKQLTTGKLTNAEAARLVYLERSNQLSDGLLNDYRQGVSLSDWQLSDLSAYLGNYAQQDGTVATQDLVKNGAPIDYLFPYAGSAKAQAPYLRSLSDIFFGNNTYQSQNRDIFNEAKAQAGLNMTSNSDFLPSMMAFNKLLSLIGSMENSPLATGVYLTGTAFNADQEVLRQYTELTSQLATIGSTFILPKTNISPLLSGTNWKNSYVSTNNVVVEGGLLTNKQAVNPTNKPNSINITIDSSQMGKKLGKHVSDFGGNPANAADRQGVIDIINNIANNPDKVIQGTFKGQGLDNTRGDVFFIIKGNDVVVTKLDGSFVTIMKDGVINNTSVKNSIGSKQ